MRKVYGGRVKEGQEGLREVQKVLISQFTTKPSEFLKDLQRMEKEHAERIQEWRLAKLAAKAGPAAVPVVEVAPKDGDLRELCDRLIGEAAA